MSDVGVARIFRHGRSQAVRLPLAFRLPGDRARLRRIERGILLEPMMSDIDAWFARGSLCRRAIHGGGAPAAANASGRGSLRVNYLLDTNALIAVLKDHPPGVRSRLRTLFGS